MTDLNESTYVEKPFLDQLEGLGWDILELEMTSATEESYRSAYSDIIKRENWWTKYHTPAKIIESERDAARSKMNKFLEELGYGA